MVLTSESYERVISDFLGVVQKHHASSLQNFSTSKGPQSRAIEIQKWGFLLHLLRCVAYVDIKTQVLRVRGEGEEGEEWAIQYQILEGAVFIATLGFL
jgi:hypothetical protein